MSAVEVVCKGCIDRRLRELTFVLIRLEGAVSHSAMQGVRRPS
jgi:hypothetical protein